VAMTSAETAAPTEPEPKPTDPLQVCVPS
jgi:hypothetical protein